MITATGKLYACVSDNNYIEDATGACVGAEWLDEHGNTLIMLWAFTPIFNPSGKYAEMLYKIFIKPVGRESFILDAEITDHLGVDKYFQNDITNTLFGKLNQEPYDENGLLKQGLVTQIQFFVNHFIVNIHNIPMSFKMFIYPFIESTQNVTIS